MNIHFGILQVLHEFIISPGDDFFLDGVCVRKYSSLTYSAPKQTLEIWPTLLLVSLFPFVTQDTLLKKNLLIFLNITHL
jgi:hypothetical protein